MCLIIQKPRGRQVAPDFLQHAWERNDDGWGAVRLDAGRPAWTKGLKLDELLAYNAELPPQAEAYLHLRKATYGEVNADMAHPHVVREGLLLMHNGSIHHLAPCNRAHSDSAELARALRDLLTGLDDDQAATLLRTEGFRRLTAPLVKGSMVLLLDAQGAVCLGRQWHLVAAREWHAGMAGLAVSNTHAWTPRSVGPWQHLGRAARRHWSQWVARPLAMRAASGG